MCVWVLERACIRVFTCPYTYVCECISLFKDVHVGVVGVHMRVWGMCMCVQTCVRYGGVQIRKIIERYVHYEWCRNKYHHGGSIKHY